jgi:hypothetical protein
MKTAIIAALGALPIIFLSTMFIPVKRCVALSELDGSGEFYIIRYNRPDVCWNLLGDSAGRYGKRPMRRIRPTGRWFAFENMVSIDLFAQGNATSFIVRGTLTKDEHWDKSYGDTSGSLLYTLKESSWDIFGDIVTTNRIRGFSRKHT